MASSVTFVKFNIAEKSLASLIALGLWCLQVGQIERTAEHFADAGKGALVSELYNQILALIPPF